MKENPHREFKEVDGIKMTRFQYMKLPEMVFEWSEWEAESGETRLWIVGINKRDEDAPWELKGVFSSEELARESCRDDQRCFTYSVLLNQDLGVATVHPPDGYYPDAPEDWTHGPEYQ